MVGGELSRVRSSGASPPTAPFQHAAHSRALVGLPLPGRLAQLGERRLDKAEVTGSSPVSPTGCEAPRMRGFLVLGGCDRRWGGRSRDSPTFPSAPSHWRVGERGGSTRVPLGRASPPSTASSVSPFARHGHAAAFLRSIWAPAPGSIGTTSARSSTARSTPRSGPSGCSREAWASSCRTSSGSASGTSRRPSNERREGHPPLGDYRLLRPLARAWPQPLAHVRSATRRGRVGAGGKRRHGPPHRGAPGWRRCRVRTTSGTRSCRCCWRRAARSTTSRRSSGTRPHSHFRPMATSSPSTPMPVRSTLSRRSQRRDRTVRTTRWALSHASREQ
jgi:hypothetical protein